MHLLVADSRTAEPPPEPLELLFIDGDHSYEGAKADFERWRAFVRPGGHVLFHDAVDTGGYGNVYPGVARLIGEIGDGWERQPGAGSIAHFVKRVMRLVAVVLNWNGGDDTLAALASLEGIETICVDNGSTDGSDRAVEERFPARRADAHRREPRVRRRQQRRASRARSSAAPTGCCS